LISLYNKKLASGAQENFGSFYGSGALQILITAGKFD